MNSLTDTRANQLEILNLMLQDKDARIEALSILKVDYFSVDLAKRLFKTIEYMEKNSKKIDLVLVIQEMEGLGLKKDGDISNITEIYNQMTSISTLDAHIEKMIEGYRSNELKKKMFNYVNESNPLDADGVINDLSKIIEDKSTGDTTTIQLQEWLLNEVGKRLGFEKPQPLGLLTGYRDLDKILRGIVPGSIVTLLARSGVGKTTFSVELSKKIASKYEPITYFSLEMSPEQMYLKMVLSEAKLGIDDYLTITAHNTNAVNSISMASNKVSALNIKFSQERNIKKIVSLVNYYVRKTNTKVFIIDYLNIVQSDIITGNTDVLYNEITAELKQVALKTGSIIFLIVQANRTVDSQQDKRPNLKDIKSSSSIEQNSDYIISLYRNLDFNNPVKTKELYNEGKLDYNSPNADINPLCFELIVLKNRHTGEGGNVYLKYSSSSGYMNWSH